MKIYLEQKIKEAIHALVEQKKITPECVEIGVQLDRTKNPAHGDYAVNIALILSKKVGKNPRELATDIISAIGNDERIEKIEIAGPGFINFYVKQEQFSSSIEKVLKEKNQYGRCDIGKALPVHIEYVSANPTGPLHVGHGRGAAYGSAVSNILEAVGYKVHREYYVNDAGRQMDILAASVWLRYLESFQAKLVFPANGYRGDYVLDIAKALAEKYQDRFVYETEKVFENLPLDEPQGGDKEIYIDAIIHRAKKLLGADFSIIHQFGNDRILDDIKDDLKEFGVKYDEWFSELSLMQSGAINKGISALEAGGYVYREKGALWFRSTKFGDEKDRVLIRENGQTTYFASDVAYHWNKLDRGYQEIIDVFGADHHGYIPRVKAAMEALGLNSNRIKVPLVQFAILYRGDEKVQMSTRSGQFVTLRQLREEVGKDAARFFYVMRKAEQHMDFDLELAKSKTNENPVYYIQYAHARICSVFRQLVDKGLTYDEKQGLASRDLLTESYEKTLAELIGHYPEVLMHSADKLEPHQLANYLKILATGFHTYYNACQFIVENNALRQARLCLIAAVRQVIQNGLELLAVSAPEEM